MKRTFFGLYVAILVIAFSIGSASYAANTEKAPVGFSQELENDADLTIHIDFYFLAGQSVTIAPLKPEGESLSPAELSGISCAVLPNIRGPTNKRL